MLRPQGVQRQPVSQLRLKEHHKTMSTDGPLGDTERQGPLRTALCTLDTSLPDPAEPRRISGHGSSADPAGRPSSRRRCHRHILRTSYQTSMLRYDLAAALVAVSECRVEIKRHSDEHGVVSEVHTDFLEPGQRGTIGGRDKYPSPSPAEPDPASEKDP